MRHLRSREIRTSERVRSSYFIGLPSQRLSVLALFKRKFVSVSRPMNCLGFHTRRSRWQILLVIPPFKPGQALRTQSSCLWIPACAGMTTGSDMQAWTWDSPSRNEAPFLDLSTSFGSYVGGPPVASTPVAGTGKGQGFPWIPAFAGMTEGRRPLRCPDLGW